MKGITNSVHSILKSIGPKRQAKGHNQKEGRDTFYEGQGERSDKKGSEKEELREEKIIQFEPDGEEVKSLCEELNKEEYYLKKNLTFSLGDSPKKILVKDHEGKTVQTLTYFQLIKIRKEIAQRTAPKKGSLLNISC